MKRPGAARREHRDRVSPRPFAGNDAVRATHLNRIWIFEPAPDKRARKIHPLVAVSLPSDWGRNWLGDVSLLAIVERNFWRSIDRNFARMVLSKSGPR